MFFSENGSRECTEIEPKVYPFWGGRMSEKAMETNGFVHFPGPHLSSRPSLGGRGRGTKSRNFSSTLKEDTISFLSLSPPPCLNTKCSLPWAAY